MTMRVRMHYEGEFFLWEEDCIYSVLKATCGHFLNALLSRYWGILFFQKKRRSSNRTPIRVFS
jgi:hypothetical protein